MCLSTLVTHYLIVGCFSTSANRVDPDETSPVFSVLLVNVKVL